ncbi:MAG: BACON domain-containing protein, partial [Rikenellaceae bacterium]|nr:BACON domain-containing protein [Rikenellaceae bacterium]
IIIMTRLFNKNYVLSLTLSFIVLQLIGCKNEARINEGEVDEGEVSLRLEVRLPADADNALTRRMTAEEEVVVSTTDVYHFVDVNDDGTYVGVNSAPIPGTYTAGSEDLIQVTLHTYPGKKSRLVFLLNARQTGNYGYAMYAELDQFLETVIHEQPDEWKSARGACDPLPMYGITGDVEIKKEIPNNLLTDNGDPFPLIRMHAKFNMCLFREFTASGKFYLESVCVFNRKTHGYLPYHESLWDAAAASGPCATGPHIPVSCGNVYEPPTPYFTVCTDAARTDFGMIVNKQYCLEADNANEPDRLAKTALVIGGKYEADTDISYYRLDINVTDGNILRNHLYDIEIQSVAGRGESTAKEAFEGVSQLTARIVAWNLAGQYTLIDGQFWFEIDCDEYYFYREGGQVEVTAQTNYNVTDRGYPAGLYIDPTAIVYTPESQSDWITLSDVSGADGSLTRQFRITAAAHTGNADRSARISVTAGNLTQVILITQGTDLP